MMKRVIPLRGFDSATGRMESVDARMLALMRCILAFSALAVIVIDPSEPARFVALTYASLASYCAYSVAIAVAAFRRGWPAPSRYGHWLDVLFYSCLIALTEGTNSIFFHFFFFSILVASFSWGFREGLLVTVVSTASFLMIGGLSMQANAGIELNRALIRPIYLFALGYMIAYWGGHEILLKRRLKLLQEVSNAWHPRFGVDHTIAANLDRLREFFSAELCLLVLKRPTDPVTYWMVAASPTKPAQAAAAMEINPETASPLLRLPEDCAATYCVLRRPWPVKRDPCAVYGLAARAHDAGANDACQAVAGLLDAPSFVTVRYAQRDGTQGRIYLTSTSEAFARGDVDFLLQWAGTLAPVVENLALMGELVSKASEYERDRISRDIHDTTIQPYIGLKLGLEALLRDAGPDNALSGKVGELIDMTVLTVRDLRAYAENLKEGASLPGEHLLAAVREQAERYRRFYAIEVEVKADISARLTGRLAADAYQIIVEGLSNILRHTAARKAVVAMLCEPEQLILKISNDNADAARATFTPRSIDARVRALGGSLLVEREVAGYTTVHIVIPY